MKISITLSAATLLCFVTIGAQAQVSSSYQSLRKNAQESAAQRFPIAINQTKNYGKFPADPWCGFKGQKVPTVVPSAEYPNFNNGKVESTVYPTVAELQWLKGLNEQATPADQKTYVDANLSQISYEHMSHTLLQASKHCFWRSRSNGTTQIIAIENDYADALLTASDDCKNYPGFEKELITKSNELKTDQEKLQEDATKLQSEYNNCKGLFMDCNIFQSGGYEKEKAKLEDRSKFLESRKKQLENDQALAKLMFKSCMDFTQLFTSKPAVYRRPT